MNQDELIAKLTPAIGLRRQLDPRAAVKPVKYSGQIQRIRPLQPAERAFSDETLDTIMVEHEANRWHEHPAGLLVASGSVLALTWFPGETPTTIRLLAEGISVLTGRATSYVQIFAGTTQQITAAISTAKTADAWSDEDLAN
jgi:hypothetical protein